MATPGPERAYRIEWEEHDVVIRFPRNLIGPENVSRFLSHLSLVMSPAVHSEAEVAALADELERAVQNKHLEQEPR
jgi:hypothetical protein